RFRTNEQLLEQLRRHVEVHGSASAKEIGPHNGLPSHATYSKRFGSLGAVYDLIGFQPKHPLPRQEDAKGSRLFRKSVEASFKNAFEAAGVPLKHRGPVLAVRGCRPFTFEVARCFQRIRGELRWQVYCRRVSHKHPCAVARLNPGNRTVKDWVLLMQVPKFKEH